MKHHSVTNGWNVFSFKKLIVIGIFLMVMEAIASSFKNENNIGNKDRSSINKDSVESAKAFLEVYKVLMSPRCMNCHPAGDQPLNGDDSHAHAMNVQRGMDGKGLYALKCSNCHQPENIQGIHTPPGNPKWQLPPSDMKMVFQGKTAQQLAMQIMDYKQNGHKDKKQLLEHARDTLVKAAWHMGGDRTPPPLSYKDFLKVWDTWINKGGYAPKP
jgi:hypothetical protein